MPGSTLGFLAVAVAAYCVPLLAQAQPKGAGTGKPSVPVTVKSFPRAESDTYFAKKV